MAYSLMIIPGVYGQVYSEGEDLVRQPRRYIESENTSWIEVASDCMLQVSSASILGQPSNV